jgi:hypothetical protein
MVEVGVWISESELLDDPPGRGGEGDVVAFRRPRVENTDHMTLVIEDERAGVANGQLVVSIDSGFDGFNAKVIAKVGLQDRRMVLPSFMAMRQGSPLMS